MSLDYNTMSGIEALVSKFELLFDNCDLDDEYAEYIMDNCHGERVICNGDTLIEAMEDGYLYDGFKEYWIDKQLTLYS